MSDQSYASLNDPYWISSRGTDKILWNKLDNPPLAPLDKGITYELNDSRLYHNGNKLSYESETGTIQNGTTTKLSYYSDTNQLSASDINYESPSKLTIGTNTLINANFAKSNISVGSNIDLFPVSGPTHVVAIGWEAGKNLSSPNIQDGCCVILGSVAGINATEVDCSTMIGYGAGGGFGPYTCKKNTFVGFRNCSSILDSSNNNTVIGSMIGRDILRGSGNCVISSHDTTPRIDGSNNCALNPVGDIIGSGNLYLNAQTVGTDNNIIRLGKQQHVKNFQTGIRGITPDIADGNVVEISSDGQLTSSSSYVKGPANSVDNTVVVFDQSTGKLIKNTNILAVDRDLTNVSNLETENATITTGSIYLPDTTGANVGTIRNSTGVLFHSGGGPSYETYLGYNNGNFSSTGINNTVIGGSTLNNLSTGSNNIVCGYSSANNITTHSDNIIIGNFVTGLQGSNNILIGNIAGVAEENTIRIGGTQSSVYCDVINQKTPTEIRYVFIDSTGLLSSRLQLYKPHAEVLFGDGGLSLASFVLTDINVWYSIDTSNFQTGIFSQDNNNAKFLTEKFDDNGIPGMCRYLGTTPDKGHSSISLSMNTTNAGNVYQVCVLQNSTPIPSTIAYFDFANNNAYASSAWHKLLNMSQNDVFSVGVRCTSANSATVGLYNLDFFVMNMEAQL